MKYSQFYLIINLELSIFFVHPIVMKLTRGVLSLLFLLFFGCEGQQSYNKDVPSNQESIIEENSSSEVDDIVADTMKVGNSLTKEEVKGVEDEIVVPQDEVSKIQSILYKANPNYNGQGKLHEENGEIVAAEFPNCGLKDLSPLRGLKLKALDLSGNPVREIRHLRGMPLVRLFLEFTLVEKLDELVDAQLVELRLNGSPVQSLNGLEGQPLENLYAVGTQINNVNALSKSNLRQLWLTESPVADLSPLAGLPLVSLTIHQTLVEDLSFVRKLPLIQRLHIGETLIADLTPLRGLNLTRLVFTPSRIKKGMAVAKSLSNIKEIGTKFDDQGKDLMPPDAFWLQFQP